MSDTLYLGVDVGSISTKGVLIDSENRVISKDYIWTEGNPVNAVKNLIKVLTKDVPQSVNIQTVGTTGSARKLIGAMLDADVVKNEITAHAVGTLSRFPDTKTIIEIGGQDSKLILLSDGVVVDYAMNTLCAAGTGSFLSSQAKRLGMNIEDIGEIALKSTQPTKIAARCTVFAESDMVHKAQIGHKKEDLVAGLCSAVVSNYLNNVAKGKVLKTPIVFQGGVSKNQGVVQAFKTAVGSDVLVDEDSHLMGAVGAAILSRQSNRKKEFQREVSQMNFNTITEDCSGCSNNCEIVQFFREQQLLDTWGNRCGNYKIRHSSN